MAARSVGEEGTAMFAAKHRLDERAGLRERLDATATARTSADVPVDVLVTDLSLSGCFLEAPGCAPVGAVVTIGLAGIGQQQAFVVRSGRNGLGCRFTLPLTPAEFKAALACGGTVVPFCRE